MDVVQGKDSFNVTLPMILSEWHRLSATSLRFGAFLERFFTGFYKDYFEAWVPENVTVDWQEIIMKRSVYLLTGYTATWYAYIHWHIFVYCQTFGSKLLKSNFVSTISYNFKTYEIIYSTIKCHQMCHVLMGGKWSGLLWIRHHGTPGTFSQNY